MREETARPEEIELKQDLHISLDKSPKGKSLPGSRLNFGNALAVLKFYVRKLNR